MQLIIVWSKSKQYQKLNIFTEMAHKNITILDYHPKINDVLAKNIS